MIAGGRGRAERFTDVAIDELRGWPLRRGLETLGLHFKADVSYTPRSNDERLHVTLDTGRVVELVITGIRWFDTKAEKGGGGVIDLAMHVGECSFVTAVGRLSDA